MTHELEKLQRKGTTPTCPHCDATVLSTSQPERSDNDDLVSRLRERAKVAREEMTGTSLGDALHFEDAANEIERLRGAATPAVGGKPVAWRYQRKEGWDDIWRYATIKPDFETPYDWVVQPLYAAQPASPLRGRVPERETWWLAERFGHGQYAASRDQLPSLTPDPWRAVRFTTEQEAFDFILQLTTLRDEMRPTEHVFINKFPLSASLPEQPAAEIVSLDKDRLVAAYEAYWENSSGTYTSIECAILSYLNSGTPEQPAAAPATGQDQAQIIEPPSARVFNELWRSSERELCKLEGRILEYANDLRRNSSGGDDYPWEYAKATADYLETLITTSRTATDKETQA
jgi:hypothetical protein